MTHPTQEQLVLYHYDETDRQPIDAHLSSCERCQRAYRELRRMFGALDRVEVPARDPAYPERVWDRIERRLGRTEVPTWQRWFSVPRLSVAAAVAALVVVAFVAGRFQGRQSVKLPALADQTRERVLLVAVGDHLESTQRVLIELVRAERPSDLDLPTRQRQAARLASDSRLYGVGARMNGDERMAELLEDLERILLEVANGPSALQASDWNELRRRIEKQGILMRVRVLGDDARRRGVQRPETGPDV